MKKKFQISYSKQILIHNEIFNAAHYLKENIIKKEAEGNHEGLNAEYMSCLTMLAFTYEAIVRFYYTSVIGKWQRNDHFNANFKLLAEKLGISLKDAERPKSSFDDLRDIRNTLAHGTAEHSKDSIEIIATDEEIKNYSLLTSHWHRFLNSGFLEQAYADVDNLHDQLRKAVNLDPFDEVTRGEMKVVYLGPAEGS